MSEILQTDGLVGTLQPTDELTGNLVPNVQLVSTVQGENELIGSIEPTGQLVGAVHAEESLSAKVSKPISVGGTYFITDETLTLKDCVLSVNTAKEPDPDNTLPITSAAVATTVGNINELLKTI